MTLLIQNPKSVNDIAEISTSVIQEIKKAIIGKDVILEKLMAAFLSSNGHVLLEDYPGLAKTKIAKCFSDTLGLDYKRIQFTPDLLPSDIIGGYIFNTKDNTFSLRKGPVFSQILLADEINRASPKTQSALLEAMQENQVTMEGEKISLPDPFIVIATQNPIEYEGTFPLPEAQLDRFILRLSIGYPSKEEEKRIIAQRNTQKIDSIELSPIINSEILVKSRQVVEDVFIHPDLQSYIVDIVTTTRDFHHIELGVSPRGSLALLKLSKAWAAIHGRDYVIPDDIKILIKDVLGHRMILDPNLWGNKFATSKILDEIISIIPVPVLSN